MPIVTASSEECSSRCRLASFLFLHCLGTVNWVFFSSRFRLLFSSCCHHFFVVVFADPRSEDMMAVTGYCLILPHSHCGLVNFRSGTGNGFFPSIRQSYLPIAPIAAVVLVWAGSTVSSSHGYWRWVVKGYNKRCVFPRWDCEASNAKKGETAVFLLHIEENKSDQGMTIVMHLIYCCGRIYCTELNQANEPG